MLLEEVERCEGIEGRVMRMKTREGLEKVIVLMGWPGLVSRGMAHLNKDLKEVMG